MSTMYETKFREPLENPTKEERKYELIYLEDEYCGPYQIRAVRDFGDVKAGDLGGWVDSEDNLSHKGICWIYDNAGCFDYGRVEGNATLHDRARIKEYGIVRNDAKCSGMCDIRNHAIVEEGARIEGGAVLDKARVFGQARITSGVHLHGNAEIGGYSTITGNDIRIYSGTTIESCNIVNARILEIHNSVLRGGEFDASNFGRISGIYYHGETAKCSSVLRRLTDEELNNITEKYETRWF